MDIRIELKKRVKRRNYWLRTTNPLPLDNGKGDRGIG